MRVKQPRDGVVSGACLRQHDRLPAVPGVESRRCLDAQMNDGLEALLAVAVL